MNIFVLDNSIKLNAQFHCDKHVVKMPLESAQMLCTCLNMKTNTTEYYKSSHINHPCNVWLRSSYGNCEYLMELLSELNSEYKSRFNSKVNHKSFEVGSLAFSKLNKYDFDTYVKTEHPLCIPDDCKTNDIVESYRLYYIKYKSDLLKYKSGKLPYWIQ